MNQHPPSFGNAHEYHEILKIWVPNMEQHYTKNTWEIPSNDATRRDASWSTSWTSLDAGFAEPRLHRLGEFQSGERWMFPKTVGV